MINLRTACSACSFYKEKSCSAGVLDKFSKRGEVSVDSDGNHIVERVCQYRNHDNSELEEVRERIFPRVNYVVIHRENKSSDDLRKTLQSINMISFKHNLVIITDGNVKFIMNFCKEENLVPNNTVYIKLLEEKYMDSVYDEAFARCKNGYVMFLESGDSVDRDFLLTLDKALNEKMLKVVAITDINCYMAVLYKNLKGYFGKSLKEKIDMMIQLNPETSNTVYTMEKLNEATID